MTSPHPSADRSYRPQLDTLRALAVLAVLASHFWPSLPLAARVGPQGVNLFFVLSGFLITGILLDCRALVERTGQSVGATMRHFYARRALRLLPLCYGALLVAWAVGVSEVRASLWWHLGYLTNVYFTRTDGWHFPVSHLWSLAVEEQFYVVWPAVILLAPRRRLVAIVVAVVASAPLFRALAPHVGVSDMAVWTLPFGKLDALGLGALLALSPSVLVDRWPRWLVVVVGPAAVVALYPALHAAWTPPPLRWAYAADLWQTAVNVLFAAAVLGAAVGLTGVAGRVASLRPLVYVGRISYGVYLLHLFVEDAAMSAFRQVDLPWPQHGSVRFALLTALTIAAAAASWHFYERPLNALKRHFPYRVPHEAARSALGVS